MKLCEKCGAYNSDHRTFCVDCGDTLGDPVSPQHEEEISERIEANMETMYNRQDPLYVSRLDKICGFTSLAGAAASVVLMVFRLIPRENMELLLFSLIFFVVAAVEALVPRLNWEFEKLRLRYYVRGAEELEPGHMYFISRKCVILLASALALLSFIIALW